MVGGAAIRRSLSVVRYSPQFSKGSVFPGPLVSDHLIRGQDRRCRARAPQLVPSSNTLNLLQSQFASEVQVTNPWHGKGSGQNLRLNCAPYPRLYYSKWKPQRVASGTPDRRVRALETPPSRDKSRERDQQPPAKSANLDKRSGRHVRLHPQTKRRSAFAAATDKQWFCDVFQNPEHGYWAAAKSERRIANDR